MRKQDEIKILNVEHGKEKLSNIIAVQFIRWVNKNTDVKLKLKK